MLQVEHPACSPQLLLAVAYCHYQIVTFRRHMLVPQQDTLTFDVFLGEGGMPLQSMLALGQPKAVRALLRDEGVLGQGRRLGDFAKPMQVGRRVT